MGIRRFLLGLGFAAALSFPAAAHAAAVIVFDGVTYHLVRVVRIHDVRVAEYRRPGETFNRWTRKVAVWQLPRETKGPRQAAVNFSQALKAHFPQVHDEILQAQGGREVQIDFVLVVPKGPYMQFDIRRYARRAGYRGLISYEYSYRLVNLSSLSVAKFRRQRRKWIEEMLHVNWPIPFSGDKGSAGSGRAQRITQ